MAEPVGTRAALRRAARVETSGVAAAAVVGARGAVGWQTVAGGVATGSGCLVTWVTSHTALRVLPVGGKILVGSAGLLLEIVALFAVPAALSRARGGVVPWSAVMVVTDSELVLRPLGALTGRVLRRATPTAIPLGDLRSLTMTAGQQTQRLHLELADGEHVDAEARSRGRHAPNVEVFRLVGRRARACRAPSAPAVGEASG